MTRYLGTINITYKYRPQHYRRPVEKTIKLDVDINIPYTKFGKEVNNIIRNYRKELVDDALLSLQSPSPYEFLGLVNIETDIYNTHNNRRRTLRAIRMRRSIAPILLDDEIIPHASWDRNEGTCVIDYLQYKYSHRKGLIKLLSSREKIIDLLKTTKDTFTTYTTPYDEITIWEGEDLVSDGVSIENIFHFADKIKVPVYVLNDFKYVIEKYEPSVVDKTHPVLCFKISNNHFYPIENTNNKKKYAMKYHLSKGKDIKTNILIELLDNEKKLFDTSNIIYEDSQDCVEQHFKNLINRHIFPSKIMIQKSNIYAFKDDIDNIIVHNPYHNEIEQSCIKYSIKYTNQSIGVFAFQLLEKITGISIPYSSHNSYVFDTLVEAKNNRIRVGKITDDVIYDRYIEKTFNVKDGIIKKIDMHYTDVLPEYKAYDITKCYRSSLYDTKEDWIVLSWTDQWKPYIPRKTIPLGLFYVKTQDTTLFKKSNIYSTSIIKHAIKNNIDFTIIKELIPSNKKVKSFFKYFIDDILRQYGETDFSKAIINILTGMMGKHKSTSTSCQININPEQVFDWLNKNEKNVYVNNINTENNPIYLYGEKKTTYLNETCLPIYIQITDNANIQLYDMAKQFNTVAYKTDCIIVKPPFPKNIIQPTTKWGQYRECSVPLITCDEKYHSFKLPVPYWNKYDITDSDDWEKVYDIIQEKSVLIDGRAGTGKSYLVKKIKAKLEQNHKKVLVLAPTNKCALAWKGKTIHKGLQLSLYTKLSNKQYISKLKTYDYVIIDEVSMITADVWNILDYVKKSTDIKFILIGDKNQLPPIEDIEIPKCYLESQGVKSIAEFNKISLKIIKRYDPVLAQLGDDIIQNVPIDITRFPPKLNTRRNLCYFNKTRKQVNQTLNQQNAPPDALFLPNNSTSKYPQDALIYPNVPIIAYKTHYDEDIQDYLCVNSENFVIDDVPIYDDKINLYSIRPDDDGNEMIHHISIDKNEFHNYFLLNYCTTTHKAQGDTIDENINIYDWDAMHKKLRYTAITRVKKMSQVGIIP
jgi:hypothetical protein